MRRSIHLASLVTLVAVTAPSAEAQTEQQPALEARVWLDRGEEPVLRRGDQVRVYYRASEDAYAAIFRIDTDGGITMVFPQHPGALEPVRAGRDYRLLFPSAPTWPVADDPGVGYFFMIASPEPLDLSAFPYDAREGWDLGAVGGVVYEDPYVAIDDYVAALIPDWDVVPYALDFLTYHVESTYAYPRFLCYDCHTAQPYRAWNPYDALCTSVRVVVWDDPYFYPAYRYSGTRVVVAQRVRALPRFELTVRAVGDIGVRPVVRARTAPERRVAQFKEAPTVDPATRVPGRRATPSAASQRVLQERTGARSGQASGDVRPTLQRRSGGALPVRTPPSAAPETTRQTRSAPIDGGRAARPSSGGATQPSAGRRETERPPSAGRGAPERVLPTRPSAPARARPDQRGAGSQRPDEQRPGRARVVVPGRSSAGATPSRPTARPSAPQSRPSAPQSRPSAPPAARAPSRPAARPAPAPREPSSRPAVQSRRPARGTARGN